MAPKNLPKLGQLPGRLHDRLQERLKRVRERLAQVEAGVMSHEQKQRSDEVLSGALPELEERRAEKAKGVPSAAGARSSVGLAAETSRGDEHEGGASGPVSGKPGDPSQSVFVTSISDDPSVGGFYQGLLPESDFFVDDQGEPKGLVGSRVWIHERESIHSYGLDHETLEPGDLEFAKNGWVALPQPKPGAVGFAFVDESGEQELERQRGANGKLALDEKGREVWTRPAGLHAAQSVAFSVLNEVHRAASEWAGRNVPWGNGGQLEVFPHDFIGLNAYFAPWDRSLRMGISVFRDGDALKTLETATSRDILAHEAGHAIHHALKPNEKTALTPSGQGFGQWGESFGDQMALWMSLRDPERARQLVESLPRDAAGKLDLSQSNRLSRIGELFGRALGKGEAPLRDAVNDFAMGDKVDEVHEKSEVLTGAAYRVFGAVFERLRSAMPEGPESAAADVKALRAAADVMGTLLVRATEHTPENFMSLHDVAKAYLTVDRECFGGAYGQLLRDEFLRRGLLRPEQLDALAAHETQIRQLGTRLRLEPGLDVGSTEGKEALSALLTRSGAELGVAAPFGLELQSAERASDGRTVVRVQLVYRTPGADGAEGTTTPVGNHGILVFRADGSLADYHGPFVEGLSSSAAEQALLASSRGGWASKAERTLVPRAGTAAASGAEVVAFEHVDGKAGQVPMRRVFDAKSPKGRNEPYPEMLRVSVTPNVR